MFTSATNLDRVMLALLAASTTCVCIHEYIENHNSLGHEWPSGLDVKQSPNVQDMFQQCQASSAALMYMYMYVHHVRIVRAGCHPVAIAQVVEY